MDNDSLLRGFAAFQVNSEIAIGVETTGRPKSYSLHNLMFDRVSMPGRK